VYFQVVKALGAVDAIRDWLAARKGAAPIRRRRVLALVVLVGAWGMLGLTASSSALAAPAAVPPAGTPDLSQMVLQPSDFSLAGPLQQDAYTTPSSAPVVASYARLFGPSMVGRTQFLVAGSDADLFTDPATATSSFQVANRLLQSRQGRRALTGVFIQSFNQGAHRHLLQFRDVHFLHVHSLGVGDSSCILPATLKVQGMKFSLQFLFVRVDRAVGTLVLFGLGKIHSTDAMALAQAIASHMRSALAAPTAG
jgi:hypothetical protein